MDAGGERARRRGRRSVRVRAVGEDTEGAVRGFQAHVRGCQGQVAKPGQGCGQAG